MEVIGNACITYEIDEQIVEEAKTRHEKTSP